MKTSVKQRYMDHLKAKGKLPKDYSDEPEMMADGGIVHGGEMDEEDEWVDDGWNDHDDQHHMYNCGGMVKKGYAAGGEVDGNEMKKRFAMALMRRGAK